MFQSSVDWWHWDKGIQTVRSKPTYNIMYHWRAVLALGTPVVALYQHCSLQWPSFICIQHTICPLFFYPIFTISYFSVPTCLHVPISLKVIPFFFLSNLRTGMWHIYSQWEMKGSWGAWECVSEENFCLVREIHRKWLWIWHLELLQPVDGGAEREERTLYSTLIAPLSY